MKNKLFLIALSLFMGIGGFAQNQNGINYQTTVRTGQGNVIANIEVSLQMSIRTRVPDGEIV